MSRIKGTETTSAVYEETVYGVAPDPANGFLLHKTAFTLQKVQPRVQDETILSNRSRSEPMLDNVDVSGALNQNMSAQSLGVLLKHLMGVVNTTGSDPYTHVFTVGQLPVGLMFENDYGSKITGSGRVVRYHGCKIASANFSFPVSGPVTASFNIIGADAAPASAALDETLTDLGHKAFSSFNASLTEGGDAFGRATSIELTIDNELDTDGYVIGGQGKRNSLDEGFVTISGTLNAQFANADLMNKALSDTESSLAITVSRGTGAGSAGNESIKFELNQIKYEPTTPPIDGPAGLSISLNFFAYAKASDLGMVITLKNAVATV
ncbi:MAG: hypothetical protein Tp1111SUR522732_16 [Prokaryotic dsDNA virus sp.]|uniref:phage tail tube protein n=1 Tax=Methylophaga sp. UBA2689 TaxID=1946878 RepID=UPI00118A9C44|nr:phage tail tube protein [Methylophaga sp. UBA2689]QDP47078.1 MAG: hypothetical protein Tp1111SUR522732_16 [Prokaryotic dsDNA virus sp.]|tara:strand:- start:1728 stop:2696 length:969 start_codon:yes stop_codon:yes gene_type:complete